MKSIILSALILFLIGSVSFAQTLSKKEIKELGLSSIAEYETDLRDRRAKEQLESFTRYNKDGEVIEIKEIDNTGLVILHEKYEYDSEGRKIVEERYNPDGTLNRKHVYSWKGKLRTERKTYDAKGKLIIEKRYVYEYHQK